MFWFDPNASQVGSKAQCPYCKQQTVLFRQPDTLAEAVIERLYKCKWVNKTTVFEKHLIYAECHLDWTPTGKKKIRILYKILNELGYFNRKVRGELDFLADQVKRDGKPPGNGPDIRRPKTPQRF
jgi:hypothetical protein